MSGWWHWSRDGLRMRCHRLVVLPGRYHRTRECCGEVVLDTDRLVCLSCGHYALTSVSLHTGPVQP